MSPPSRHSSIPKSSVDLTGAAICTPDAAAEMMLSMSISTKVLSISTGSRKSSMSMPSTPEM
ncbi:hypothetical protein ACQY0O_005255 [Thecaphora frezii]